MSLYNLRTFLALLIPILFIGSFTYWNLAEYKEPKNSIVVRVPKIFNPNFSDDEFLRYFSDGNYIPLEELQKRKISLPNVCGTLLVSIENDDKIELNMQQEGSLSNLDPLKIQLANLFNEREENKVYEPNSDKIVKTVTIRANRSNQYGDVVKVIDAVKSSGADPIVLQIDYLND